jgi:hypothetical protein
VVVLFGTTIDPVTTSQQGKNARGAQILTNEGRAMKRGWLRKAVRAAPASDADHAADLAFKPPNKWRSLGEYAWNMFPYHHQSWSAGTPPR